MDTCIYQLKSFSSREFFYTTSLIVPVPSFYLVSLSESPLDFRLPELFIKFSYFSSFLFSFFLSFYFNIISQSFFSSVFSNSSSN